MLNVLVPMAGSGKRFVEAGYELPKPLIDVNGAPMLVRALDPVLEGTSGAAIRLVLVVRDLGPVQNELLTDYLFAKYPYCMIMTTPPTDGAARTCLVTRTIIDTDDPLLVVNCDQIVHPDSVRALVTTGADASVLTMRGDGSTKWSYAVIEDTEVIGVKEKVPVSDRATCGLYWFAEGQEFVAAADDMITQEITTNNEYYVAPVVNEIIKHGGTVREVRIEDHGNVFHGLGTPEDLNKYLGTLKKV